MLKATGLVAAVMMAGAGGAAAQVEIYADSVAGYSGVQTANFWEYGFYDGSDPLPWTPVDFDYLPVYDQGVGPAWYRVLGVGGYWTAINAVAMHPNGAISSAGRKNEENWAVRRWLATRRLPARITGHVADAGAAAGADGTTVKVFANGQLLFSRDLDDGDLAGFDLDIPVCLYVGSPVDFVLTPRGTSDLSDGVYYMVKVQGILEEQPRTQYACDGKPIELSVGIGGQGQYTYQWRRNRVPIQQAIERTYTVADPTPAQAGEYDCVITDVCGSITTEKAVVTVCGIDLNCDTFVDFNDYLEFLNRYDISDARADLNRDGFIDFSDYLEFLNRYDAGC
ncbi:MAG: hypothetical protein IT436_00535 [Phycisphaerales bacterium]|nr:hypothetical protein [Phycisphaerales bacterium]